MGNHEYYEFLASPSASDDFPSESASDYLAAPSGKVERLGFRRMNMDSFRLDVIGSFEFLMFEVMV